MTRRLLCGFERIATMLVIPVLAAACERPDAAIERGGTDTAVLAGPGRTTDPIPAAVSRDSLWLLAPDPAHDAVRATDTEETLIARYGAANVARESVDQGEGMLVPGTVLFPADSARRLYIQWEDTVARRRPVQVVVARRYGRWRLAPGIAMGSSLAELEHLNGGPFELGGFGGHSPGIITDWKGGRLSPLDDVADGSSWRRASIRVRPAEPYPPDVDADHYETEAVFLSSDPGMQRLQPRVVAIAVRPR